MTPQNDNHVEIDAEQSASSQPARHVAGQPNTPRRSKRLTCMGLFLVLGLIGSTVAWELQSRFIIKADPLAPSGTVKDLDISLFGLEHAINAMGIPAKHSSFNVLAASEGGGNSASTSPNPQQEMEKMRIVEEREQQGVVPRRNRAAVYLLLLGIPLAAALGLAEGIRRRSLKETIGGMIAMSFLGAAAGFLSGGLHARVGEALASRTDIDPIVAQMVPQVVACFTLALGLIAWPVAKAANKDTTLNLLVAAFVATLIGSVVYAPISQAIFIDDPFKYGMPGHIYSFGFWYLFVGGTFSLLIGNACSQIPVPQPLTPSE